MDTVNYGHLSRQLKEIRDRICTGPVAVRVIHASDIWAIESLIPEINRLERIERALESIGVNLDEEDITALELLAGKDDYGFDRNKLRSEINATIGDIQDSERELEQEQALEALAKSGFVLNDDDGETWTKDNVTVKIELIDGSKCQYRWEYESGPEDDFPGLNDFRPIRSASGLSGEFHRLLALIGQSVSSDSPEGSGTSKKEVLQ